jgi:hypothetical protein
MFEHMSMTGNQFKVFDGVVKLVPINMVDEFIGEKFSSDLSLHYGSMLKNDLSLNLSSLITLSGNGTLTVSPLFSEVGVSIPVPSDVMTVTHPTFRNPSLAIKAMFHKNPTVHI